MSDQVPGELLLFQIESRQDELLRQLEQLDERIEATIHQYARYRQIVEPEGPSDRAAA